MKDMMFLEKVVRLETKLKTSSLDVTKKPLKYRTLEFLWDEGGGGDYLYSETDGPLIHFVKKRGTKEIHKVHKSDHLI